jgi:N-acetylglutamate synthase-like GNAT family acetyltransferase
MRTAQPGDADAVTALVQRAYARYVQRMGRRPRPMDDDYAAAIARGEVTLREDDDGALAGIVVMYPEDGYLLVDNVAVDPARWGEGHGRALLEHAEAEAGRLGMPELRLYTHVTMVENIGLYGRAGWIEYDRGGEPGWERVFFRKPAR